MSRSGASLHDALTGVTLAGRYHLARFVREGALGAVFEATDAEGHAVAVKVIERALVSDDALSRFIRTASVIASAGSPRLVPILDVGHDLERDLIFLVMPLLKDADLATVLRRTGPLAPLTALRLALAAASAVAAAHALDIVHRNVKPSNLFLVEDEAGALCVRVADVGLAGRSLVTDKGQPSSRVSWQYVSPEQASRSLTVDRRTDVFSLGALLFELLSGAPPWSGASSSAELVAHMSSRDAAPLQDVAPWVDASIASVVERALSRDPERRFASAEALAARLRTLVGGDERVTTAMLVPIEPSQKAFAAARGTPEPASPFAPTLDSSSTGDPPTDPLLGHRLGGRYEVRKLLGRGGMGAVYEVEAAGGTRLAAKVILRDIADQNVALVARFLREGRSVTRIQDPHVTRTIELGTDIALGVPFIVMERLEGRDLGALFHERGAIEPLPLLRVFLQAARGLAAAHAEGIIHRDIKPANIFLHAPDAAGPLTAKICDFGLAKATLALVGEPSHELTRSGGMLGTPLYMSPEHATNAKSVDARTDVWSLCASLYEGLAGKKLWGTITSLGELMGAICTRSAPSLASVAPWVEPAIVHIVDKGLAREPADRWSGMDELAAAIEALVGERDEVRLDELSPVDAVRRAMRVPVSPRAETWAAGSVPQRASAPALVGSLVGSKDAKVGASVDAGSAPATPSGAPSRDLPGADRSPPARRRARAWIGAALAASAAIGVAALRRPHGEPSPPPLVARDAAAVVVSPEFGSKMSANADATAAYRAGIQAFRDGAGTTARQKLDAATEADPTFAAAHLRRLVLSITADETARAHATAATQLRTSLSAHDRALLDAYLPWSSVPQEPAETERKLAALVDAQKDDPDYAYFLCRIRVFLGDYRRAAEACDRAAELDPELIDALHYRALNLAYLDDVPGATRAYEACLKASRMATSCMSELALLQSAEGSCRDAVATARRWMAIEPTSPFPHRALGYALLGAGEPTEAVRDVLERTWELSPEGEREAERPRMLGAMDILAGDFARADARFREWEEHVAKSRDEFEHMLVTTWRLPLLIEMGRRDEAIRLAADYMKRRSAWTPTPNADYSIVIRAAQLSLGAMTRDAFVRERDAWLVQANARERVAGQSAAFDWSLAYTHAVLDRRDALEAFQALPRYLPLPDATTRTPDFDEPTANVFLLAGHPTEALAFAKRAARSCTALDSPLEVTRAYLRIGQASEALYDLPAACAAYREVLSRWGKSPSVTAREARAARARLACAAR